MANMGKAAIEYVKPFALSFALSIGLSLSIYYSQDLWPKPYEKYIGVCCLIYLWGVAVLPAALCVSLKKQVPYVIGFWWGIMFAMSSVFSLHNKRMNVNWPAMIPGLLVVPAIIFASGLPIYYSCKWLFRKAQKEAEAANPPPNKV